MELYTYTKKNVPYYFHIIFKRNYSARKVGIYIFCTE